MEKETLEKMQRSWPGSLTSYLVGLGFSLFFTAASFGIVAFRLLAGKTFLAMMIFLAILQAFAQLLFFLHLGKETKPHWKNMVFFFMAMVILVVLLGSIWIMSNLDTRLMPAMHKG